MKPTDILLAIAVPLIWGGGFLFAKAAIEHFPPILLMALRFSLTALVLVWFVPRPDLEASSACVPRGTPGRDATKTPPAAGVL